MHHFRFEMYINTEPINITATTIPNIQTNTVQIFIVYVYGETLSNWVGLA